MQEVWEAIVRHWAFWVMFVAFLYQCHASRTWRKACKTWEQVVKTQRGTIDTQDRTIRTIRQTEEDQVYDVDIRTKIGRRSVVSIPRSTVRIEQRDGQSPLMIVTAFTETPPGL